MARSNNFSLWKKILLAGILLSQKKLKIIFDAGVGPRLHEGQLIILI